MTYQTLKTYLQMTVFAIQEASPSLALTTA